VEGEWSKYSYIGHECLGLRIKLGVGRGVVEWSLSKLLQ
jgi:hypothetical protein